MTFDVTPKRNMHVYAPGKHEYQVIAVKLDPQPWLRVAPTTYPPSEIYHFKELDEKVETYGKPFKLVQDRPCWRRRRQEGAGRRAGQAHRQAQYQACDDKVCYAPTRIPVSFELTSSKSSTVSSKCSRIRPLWRAGPSHPRYRSQRWL